jgi:hypothetical protein
MVRWLPSEIIKPGQNTLLILPVDEFFYLRVLRQRRLGIFDKLTLHLPLAGQIHVQINHRGLDVFMAQSVFDIRYGMA